MAAADVLQCNTVARCRTLQSSTTTAKYLQEYITVGGHVLTCCRSPTMVWSITGVSKQTPTFVDAVELITVHLMVYPEGYAREQGHQKLNVVDWQRGSREYSPCDCSPGDDIPSSPIQVENSDISGQAVHLYTCFFVSVHRRSQNLVVHKSAPPRARCLSNTCIQLYSVDHLRLPQGETRGYIKRHPKRARKKAACFNSDSGLMGNKMIVKRLIGDAA